MLHRRAGADCAARRPKRLGVPVGRVYVDHGQSGTNRDRPGLRQALVAVPRPARAATWSMVRSLRSSRRVASWMRWVVSQAWGLVSSRLVNRRARVRLSIGRSVHDPGGPDWAVVVQRVVDGGGVRGGLDPGADRGGMAIAKARGQLRGRGPKLTVSQVADLVELHPAGGLSRPELAGRLGVARSTVYRSTARRVDRSRWLT